MSRLGFRIALGLGLLILFLALFQARQRRQESAPGPLPVLGLVPEFTLKERSGRDLGLRDLKGHVWAADFIFTNCSSVCPLMTLKMSRLENRLKENPQFRFVSFSVDPVRDNPEKLKNYAAIYTKNSDTWFFLTGPKKELRGLIQGGFKLTALDKPASEVGPNEDRIVHSELFVLVDKAGRIRGTYPVLEAGALEELERDMRALDQERN